MLFDKEGARDESWRAPDGLHSAYHGQRAGSPPRWQGLLQKKQPPSIRIGAVLHSVKQQDALYQDFTVLLKQHIYTTAGMYKKNNHLIVRDRGTMLREVSQKVGLISMMCTR